MRDIFAPQAVPLPTPPDLEISTERDNMKPQFPETVDFPITQQPTNEEEIEEQVQPNMDSIETIEE